MLLIVGVEAGRDGEREDLSGVRVLDDDGAVGRLDLGDLGIEGLLGHVLDVGVDGEDEILAGQGLTDGGPEHVAAGVDRGHHVAGDAVQLVVELHLKPAESVVVGADVAEHLGAKGAVRVEALELLLEVDALEVELADAVGSFGVDPSRDPCEVARHVEAREHLALARVVLGGVQVDDAAEDLRGIGAVVSEFAGNGEDGVDLGGHGEFFKVAVVEQSAAGRDLEAAGLLPRSDLYPVVVADDLQPDEAQRDQQDPAAEEEGDGGEPLPFDGCGGYLPGDGAGDGPWPLNAGHLDPLLR